MSSIKKYISGETKEWIKFGETNVDPKELSSARNIQVEFGSHDNVNNVLENHEHEIQNLKRNVAWLALHGGGGSGTGGSTPSSRKASCTITTSDGVFPVSITENQNLTIKLTNIKGSDPSIPWNIICNIDDLNVLTGKQSQGSQEFIEWTIPWSKLERFFRTEKQKQINHSLYIYAKYEDDNISGDKAVKSSIYMPTVQFSIEGLEQKIDVKTSTTVDLAVNTPLKGNFKLKVVSLNGGSTVVENTFGPFTKTNDDYDSWKISNFQDAFKNSEGEYVTGLFDVQMYLLFSKQDSQYQTMKSITKQMIVYDHEKGDVLVSFIGVSVNPDQPTEIYDNSKNIYFQFIAFKNEFTDFSYDVVLEDVVFGNEIEIVTGRTDKFLNTVTVTRTGVYAIETNHSYNVKVIIKPPSGGSPWGVAYGYMTCLKGEYAFMNYSDDGEKKRYFSMEVFNDVLNNNDFKGKHTLSCYNKTSSIVRNSISTEIEIFLPNSRSGISLDGDGKRQIRLYDTYMNIDNLFSYVVSKTEGEFTQTSKINDFKQFTICLCYKCDEYSSDDHIIFSLCNDGILEKGISIKNNGIYVKDSKHLDVKGTRTNVIHIVYDNSSSEKIDEWGPKSFYKIYVNGVITSMDGGCIFAKKDSKIDFNNLKITLNGVDDRNGRSQMCNCDIYDLEIFGYAMNEIDIFTSYLNNKIRTNYKNRRPNFDLIGEEVNKNCCTYDSESKTISSSIYLTQGVLGGRKFDFNDTFFELYDNQYVVPFSQDKKEIFVSKLSSIQLPIVYLEVLKSGEYSKQWTFKNFRNIGEQALETSADVEFSYWDAATTNDLPIRSKNVTMKLQGTSTKEDYIKNVQIDFQKKQGSGSYIVQDLFFAKRDLIPENSYVLKADIVDSSHANNASIGRFINEQFDIENTGNTFQYGFDEQKIAYSNMQNTKYTLSSLQSWDINPKLKHTVEGFQVLLFIKFYPENESEFNSEPFRCMGIYSFNIGRNAARNLGFEYITGISSEDGQLITGKSAPCILSSVIVGLNQTEPVYWVENSKSYNFDGISAWTTATSEISSGTMGEDNPSDDCRFWHQTQGEDDIKLNYLFEVKYQNTLVEQTPKTINTFNKFVSQVSQLPVEGLIQSYSTGHTESQITGKYKTSKWTLEGKSIKKEVLENDHKLIFEKLEESDVNSFDVVHLRKYFILALFFGLVDNLDKNISFRILGSSRLIADFYDMDTALGLDNLGEYIVSPTVGFKVIDNYTDDSQDYVYETMNQKKVSGFFPSNYKKFLPETYTNKIWLSLDTQRMRDLKLHSSYSAYSSLWFTLRQMVDQIADDQGYDSFVDYFVEEYFEKQLNCGTFMYNYDYTMKYLNDYDQSGEKQDLNTLTKLHGRRIDETREWLKQHIDFLDTYFFWRDKQRYIDGSNQLPKGLKTLVNKIVKISTQTSHNSIEIDTKYPIIIHSSSTANAGEVGDAATFQKRIAQINVPGGGAGKPMQINCANIIKNIDLISLGVKLFRSQDTKFDGIETLNVDGLTIAADGLLMEDFYDPSSTKPNSLKTISMNQTDFTSRFSLNLNRIQFLNVSYVNILSAGNVETLLFYESEDPSDKTTQNLRTLIVDKSGIENLYLKNQNSLILPEISGCSHLMTLRYKDCNLDNIEGNRSAISNYTNIIFNNQNTIGDVDIENVEQIKTVSLDQCQSLRDVKLCDISALTAVSINLNDRLSSVIIQNCPKVKSIKVTECPSLKNIIILNETSLTSLDLNYDTSLTSIYISKNSVSGIQSINIRNCDISGFNYYNESGEYDDIQKDPLDNLVLDFKPFTSLKSDGITMKKSSGSLYPEDKCGNFKAIRVPNKLGVSYDILDTGSGCSSLSNLQNVYGHINMHSGAFYSGKLPSNGLFLNDGNQYCGYPRFLSSILGTYTDINEALRLSTILDLFEKNTELSSRLSSSTLEHIENNIIKGKGKTGYLSVGNIEEFENREWSTNYNVTGLHQTLLDKKIKEFNFQYLLYRYSVYIRNDQKNGTDVNVQYFGTYSPTGYETQSMIDFPKNTFRYIGNTFSYINRFVYTSPTNTAKAAIPYHLTHDMMKWFPRITQFNVFSPKDCIEYNALSSCNGIVTLGTTVGDIYNKYTESIEISGDYDHSFFSKIGNIKTISYFSPIDLYLSAYVLPTTVSRIDNSFNGNSKTEILDLKALIGNCNIEIFDNSLTNAVFMIKPNTFNNWSNLTTLRFSGSTNKYLVENNITLDNLLCSYSPMYKDFVILSNYEEQESSPKEYTQQMFEEFSIGLLSNCTDLKLTKCLLANSKIPYQNVYDNEFNPTILSNMFEKNELLEDVRHMMANTKFRYILSSGLFLNQKNLQNVECAFMNTPATKFGIMSHIPYKFFYHGSNKSLRILSGTNRFDQDVLYSFADFCTNIKNSFVPTGDIVGSHSTDADQISTVILESGLSNIQAFNAVSAEYLQGEGYVYIPNDLSDYLAYCPLATVVSNELLETTEISVTYEGIPLYRTLSTLYRELSVKNSNNVPEKWRSLFCGLSGVEFEVEEPIATVTNINSCFMGNVYIEPYSGNTEPEVNMEYSPFIRNFDSTQNRFVINSSRNIYFYDDQWSHNGAIWKYNAEGFLEIDYSNYNPDHNNITTPEMSVVNVDYSTEYTIYDPLKQSSYTVRGGVMISSQMTNNNNWWFDYWMRPDYLSCFNFICAPDIFRYCSPKVEEIKQVFENCDYFVTMNNGYYGTGPEKYNFGLHGRIPPNILYPIKGGVDSNIQKNLTNITGLFKNLYHITGYATRDINNHIRTYVVPHNMFEKTKFITNFTETFSGILLNYDSDISRAFSSIQSGSQIYKINIYKIFQRCVWWRVTSVKNFLTGKYLSNINSAFETRRDTTEKVIDSGAMWGCNSERMFYNFTSQDRLPDLISRTYYYKDELMVDGNDYARCTAINSGQQRPHKN